MMPEDQRIEVETDDETVTWDGETDLPMWIDGADDNGINGDAPCAF